MELVKEKGSCCGCRTCEHVCPKSAITMETDEHGFWYPRIDPDKCVDCGLCLKKCAFQSGYKTRKEFDPVPGYAARHKDREILMGSRSGGAFTAVSDRILEENGSVYGAGYDEAEGFFKVVHKRAVTGEQRDEFRGSKYVQSDLGNVFVQVKEELQEGRKVLFSGTGCQVGALYAFLGREYENLLTIDIVCHGVPSPKFWADFLHMREREGNGRITGADFRDKVHFGWKAHRESVWVNEKRVSSRLYTKVFYLDTAGRPSCFQCVYANRNRVGDLTIADFWGHEKAVPGFNEDDKGVSLVMVNTSRGKAVWEAAARDMEVIDCTGYPYRHTNMKHPTRRPENYDEFWEDYLSRGFDYVMKKYCGYEVKLPKAGGPEGPSGGSGKKASAQDAGLKGASGGSGKKASAQSAGLKGAAGAAEEKGTAVPGRNCHIDNLKALLIILVAVGHFASKAPWLQGLLRIKNFIYVFHMPCFVFVSGYLAKSVCRGGRFRGEKVLGMLWLYLLFKLSVFLLKYGFTGKAALNLFHESQAPWYLFSLALWYLLVPFLDSLRPGRMMAFSLLLGIAAGYFSVFDTRFSLSRTVVFLPFFCAGFYLSREKLQSFLENRRLRAGCVLLFAAGAVLFFWKYDFLKAYVRILYGSSGYAGLPSFRRGGLVRLVWYAAAGILTAGLIQLVPRGRTAVSFLGGRTLQVYVLHILIRNAMIFVGWVDACRRLPDGVNYLLFLAGPVLLALLLGNSFLERLFSRLSRPKWFRYLLR